MTNVYPKSTVEFISIPVTKADGTVITTGVTYSIVLQPGPEGTHTAADIMGGQTGRLISGMTPGLYKVWAAVSTAGTGTAEAPHMEAGTFEIVN